MLCATAGTIGIAFALPRTAGAFWPFTPVNAQTDATPVLHDASLDLLDAPTNADPNAQPADLSVTTPDGAALLPSDGLDASSTAPTDSDTDTISSPSSGAISTYTVQPGDSLSQIAQNAGVSINTILWANNITDPSTIKTGTKLVILPVSGIQHTVRSGETLNSLAKKYGGDPGDIAQFNGLSSGNALIVGTTIIIPGGELTTSSGTSGSAKSSSSTSGSTKSNSGSSTTKTNSVTGHTTSSSGGAINYSDATGNPYRGGGGAALNGFFTNPLPGALLTQGLHGLDAVDLGAPAGTPILAAAKGTVLLSRTGGWNGGYGNYVIIDNGNGVETLYAHMSRTKAEVGETVSAGEVIGYVGMTGDATGNHLHFEVRGAANPFRYCAEMSTCSI